MQWDYQKIEYFITVARTLSFSAAAKELYISPQALNKQIIQLEKELGDALFKRTTRKMELTELGKHMLRCFEPSVEEFNKAAAGMDKYLARRKQTIRFGFFQAISKKEVIYPMASYLKSVDRNIEINMLGGEIDDVIEWLYQGKIDLLVTNIHDFEVWNDVEMIPFISSEAKITVSQYHPWMVKEKVTIEDMENMPLLLLERRKELESDSFYRNIRAKERRYAPNFSSMVANIELGDCYGVFPPLFESMNQMQLQYIDLPEECKFYYKTTAVYLKNSPKSELFCKLQELADEGIIK